MPVAFPLTSGVPSVAVPVGAAFSGLMVTLTVATVMNLPSAVVPTMEKVSVVADAGAPIAAAACLAAGVGV